MHVSPFLPDALLQYGVLSPEQMSAGTRQHIDDLWRFKVIFQAQFGERVALADLVSDGGLRCRCFALAMQAGIGELPLLVMKLQSQTPVPH